MNFFKRFFSHKQKVKCEPRMYLIVREDLSMKYIQGAHALADFALHYGKEFIEWENQYLICLSVFNGLALEEVRLKLRDSENFPFYSCFYEPDLKSELPTAICVFENGDNIVSETLKELRLASK